MNTQSSYVYDDHTGGEGLGRIALPPTVGNRFMPSIEDPARKYRRLVLPTRKSHAGRVSKPKLVLKPTPIIDHNPVPLPRPGFTALRETAQNKTRQFQKNAPAKTTKGKPLEVVPKKTTAKAVQKKDEGKGILDGSIRIGPYEIKKTHAAVAVGATAGGLLLLKLLL